jgi:hypothetical protein
MRIAYWDSGLHLDDPNLYWGDPSYLLEPGDAGYVADPTSASFPATQTKKSKKTMAKSDFLKAKDASFGAQLTTFKTEIPNYATALGLTTAQVTAQGADCDRYNYELAVATVYSNAAEQWTQWKKFIRRGGTAPMAGAPVAPTLPTLVAPVAAGIEARFRALVRSIKANANYNQPMGQILGIEGDEEGGPDFTTLKPILTLTPSGGNMMVGWTWQGESKFLDAIEILVNRGAGYVPLTIDTTPGYLDTEPAPAAPGQWLYKAIYRVEDQRVGQWSDPVCINVGP